MKRGRKEVKHITLSQNLYKCLLGIQNSWHYLVEKKVKNLLIYNHLILLQIYFTSLIGEREKENDIRGGALKTSLLLNFRVSSTHHMSAKGTGKIICSHCTNKSTPKKYFSYVSFRLIQIMPRFICVLQTLLCAFYLHFCNTVNPLKLAKTLSKQKFSLLSPTSQRGLIISTPVLWNFKAASLVLPGNNSFTAEIFLKLQTSSLPKNTTNNPGEKLWVFSGGWDRLLFLIALSCIALKNGAVFKVLFR